MSSLMPSNTPFEDLYGNRENWEVEGCLICCPNEGIYLVFLGKGKFVVLQGVRYPSDYQCLHESSFPVSLLVLPLLGVLQCDLIR